MDKMMIRKALFFLVTLLLIAPFSSAQIDDYHPDTETVLQLIRGDKLDLVLPNAMRDNKVDMWIHAARAGNPDPLQYEFGEIDGFLIFTDRGDRIERAMFGGIFTGSGGVENVDVWGSPEVARAIGGYDYGNTDISVYDEIGNFVEERDPKVIAVNFSDWLAVADGISHTQFEKLKKILGDKYSARIVSAENLITDFRSTRTLREITVQTNILEIARQNAFKNLARIVPGKTTLGECNCDGRVLYSATAKQPETPRATGWIRNPDYVLQPGDFISFSGDAKWMDFGFSSFGVDTKQHAYLLREGETSVPVSLQYAWDQTKKAQGIMRKHVKVGMTSKESYEAIISAMEKEGFIYTPFNDDSAEDYRILQKYMKGVGNKKSGFYFDFHAMGNNGGTLVTVGPSMAEFRRDRDDLVIKENHMFAFEYAVHTNLPERPGFPMTINFSNPQAVTNLGVEWIQPANDKIHLVN